jgi:ATP/maltotriose-dependent transcriptional regulator MalT
MPESIPKTLLTTKFRIPPQRVDLVARPQLIERLNEVTPGKLALVTAPAGFGKTTLLADWLNNALPQSYLGRLAWLSLDNADNNPLQFWTYFIAATQRVSPSLGRTLQPSLHAGAALPPIESILTALINEITLDGQPLLMGIDDYHEITNPEIHRGIAFLIENLPPNLHLVILSREDMPFSVSRYRVSGKLTEIRAADLRFSQTECMSFFNDLLSLSLSSDNIQDLNTRTEGWVAGLQLAALSLKSTDDKSAFIQAFKGSHRFLTDYLVDEVLSRQTADIQQFLWRTAILDRFCAEVCDELIESGDSHQILRQLEQANLFIIPLDDERRWFRYHHLFAEFLRLRLYEHEKQKIDDLYQRAIQWFTQAGLLREALQYAFKVQDYDQAVHLMDTLAPEILEHDNHMLLIQWAAELPQALTAQQALLCAYLGWAYLLSGKLNQAQQWLDIAEANITQSDSAKAQIIRGFVFAHRAYILFMQGDYTSTLEYAQQALALLPPENKAIRARTITCLGNAFNYAGELSEAKNSFQEAIQIAKEIGSLSMALFSYCSLGEVFRDEGRLSDAQNAYQQVLLFAEELTGQQEIPLTGFAIFELGVIARERNEFDEAVKLLEKGIKLCREWQQGEALAIGLIELAETNRLQGAFVESEAAIHDVRQVAAGISSWGANLVEGFAARLALSRGKIPQAVQWASQAGLDHQGCEMGYERFPECIPLIRLHIATGHPQKALTLTEVLISRDRAVGRMGRVLDLLAMRAAALIALDETDQAVQVLAEALQIAGSENIVRPFLDEGERLIPCLQKLPSSVYRDRLINILKARLKATPPEFGQTSLVEPLNEREISILKLMAAGCTNNEIADELYLSVNTIRWYAGQIYSKLGVKNRSAAATQARKLGIL